MPTAHLLANTLTLSDDYFPRAHSSVAERLPQNVDSSCEMSGGLSGEGINLCDDHLGRSVGIHVLDSGRVDGEHFTCDAVEMDAAASLTDVLQ